MNTVITIGSPQAKLKAIQAVRTRLQDPQFNAEIRRALVAERAGSLRFLSLEDQRELLEVKAVGLDNVGLANWAWDGLSDNLKMQYFALHAVGA